MGEVGRAAEHGDGEAAIAGQFAPARPGGGVPELKESRVHFHAVQIEACSFVKPF